jgi:hypothetical protein
MVVDDRPACCIREISVMKLISSYMLKILSVCYRVMEVENPKMGYDNTALVLKKELEEG